MADLYSIMKARVIMSDSDHAHQASFLMMLDGTIPAEGHRRILLDGLAREYAGVDGWMAYVDRECNED